MGKIKKWLKDRLIADAPTQYSTMDEGRVGSAIAILLGCMLIGWLIFIGVLAYNITLHFIG